MINFNESVIEIAGPNITRGKPKMFHDVNGVESSRKRMALYYTIPLSIAAFCFISGLGLFLYGYCRKFVMNESSNEEDIWNPAVMNLEPEEDFHKIQLHYIQPTPA